MTNSIKDQFLRLDIPYGLDDLIWRYQRERQGYYFDKDSLRAFGARPLDFYPLKGLLKTETEDTYLIGYYAETMNNYNKTAREGSVRRVLMQIETRENDGTRHATLHIGSGPTKHKDARAARKEAKRLRDEAQAKLDVQAPFDP